MSKGSGTAMPFRSERFAEQQGFDAPEAMSRLPIVAIPIAETAADRYRQGRMTDSAQPALRLAGRLSEREREVLAYVAAHYRSKAISRLIGTAPKTIDAQIASACRKLGVETRDDAVRLLLEAGVALDRGAPSRVGEKPLEAPDPISNVKLLLPDGPVTDGEPHGTSSTQAAAVARRQSAYDDLSRSYSGAGVGGLGRSAPGHDTVSDLGVAGAGSLSHRAARRVRDPSLGELSGGPVFDSGLRRLALPHAPLVRLGIALAIATALAVGVPAGLAGAVALQKLVETIQRP